MRSKIYFVLLITFFACSEKQSDGIDEVKFQIDDMLKDYSNCKDVWINESVNKFNYEEELEFLAFFGDHCAKELKDSSFLGLKYSKINIPKSWTFDRDIEIKEDNECIFWSDWILISQDKNVLYVVVKSAENSKYRVLIKRSEDKWELMLRT